MPIQQANELSLNSVPSSQSVIEQLQNKILREKVTSSEALPVEGVRPASRFRF